MIMPQGGDTSHENRTNDCGDSRCGEDWSTRYGGKGDRDK